MIPLQLPSRITTKAEALQIAADLVPPYKTALQPLLDNPTVRLPRYRLQGELAERLNAIFEWTYYQRPKLYKRARWYLFYTIATRMIDVAHENGSHIAREIDTEYEERRREREIDRRSWVFDGSGI